MENGRLLESWKEIAAYLKRSEKTCRRWESALDLPVHRLDGTPNARVFAYPDELDRWLEDKLHHHDREAAPRSSRIRRPPLVAVVAVCVLAVLGAAAFFALPKIFSKAPPVPPKNPVLVVLPFDNPTGDSALDDWRTALPDLLVTDLRQSRYVNIVPIQGLRLTLEQLKLDWKNGFPDQAMGQIVERIGADFVLTGSLIRSGEDYVANVSLRHANTGAFADSMRAEGLGEQGLFEKVDGLGRRIKRALGFTPRQVARDIDEPIRRIATGSAEAFKLYSNAAWAPSYDPYPDMVPALDKAIGLDPGFGLAYALKFSVFCNNHFQEMVDSYRKAFELSGRMSERDRLVLQAGLYHFYRRQGGQKKLAAANILPSILAELYPRETGQALDVLERLISLYPDAYGDGGQTGELAMIYADAEEWDKAITVLERATATPQGKRASGQRLFDCYLAAGRLEEAAKLMEELSRENPRANYDVFRRDLAIAQGRFEEAIDYLNKTVQRRTKGPFPYSFFSKVGYILWLKDDLDGAERAHRTVVYPGNPNDERQRSLDLAVLSLARGKAGQAIEFLRKAQDLSASLQKQTGTDMTRSLHWQLAYLYRSAARPVEALKEAEDACLDYDNPGVPASAAEKFLHLRALLNLELGRMEAFEKQAEEIKAFGKRERFPKLMRAYEHLLGVRDLRQDRAASAVQHFLKALDTFSAGIRDPIRVMCLDSLADAYLRLGESTFAVPRFDEITKPGTKESWTGDLYARSFYLKAKDYDARWRWSKADALKELAVENYSKFLALWGDGDLVFRADVSEARARLAALKAE